MSAIKNYICVVNANKGYVKRARERERENNAELISMKRSKSWNDDNVV